MDGKLLKGNIRCKWELWVNLIGFLLRAGWDIQTQRVGTEEFRVREVCLNPLDRILAKTTMKR